MKYAWIDQQRDQYTVSRLCRVLSVSRSGYCHWRVRGPSARELASQALDARVAVIHRESRCSYGRPTPGTTWRWRASSKRSRSSGSTRYATTPGLRPGWTNVDWIEGFYNRVRIHTVIGFVAPVEKERSFLAV